jgi:hypothetical protein
MEMRAGTGQRRCRLGAQGLVLACTVVPCAAQVGPLTYQNLFFNQAGAARNGDYLAADAGFVYTNNATLSNGGRGDTLAEIGLVGNTAHQGPRLDYHLDTDIAGVKYLHGSYPLEPTGYLDGGAELKLVRGTGEFSWTGRETYSQLVIDPYLPANPDNLENINTISTGPRFILRPTLRTTVTLDGLYAYVYTHSISPRYVNIDNHRYGGSLKIERAFSSASSLYLRGDYEKVFFNDHAINNDFWVADETLGYKIQSDRTVLDISGGYTELRQLNVLVPVVTVIGIELRPVTRKFSTPTWAFSFSRLLTPTQRLAIFASRHVLDAANLLQAGLGEAVPPVSTPQTAIGAPLINRVIGADWRVEGPRTSLNIGLLDTRQTYEFATASAQNRTLKDASAMVTRRLGPALDWDIGVHFERQGLTGARAVNGTTEITSLHWRLGGRFGLRFLYAHSTFYGINDNQVAVLATYMLLGGGKGAAPAENAVPALSPYGLKPLSPLSTMPPLH